MKEEYKLSHLKELEAEESFILSVKWQRVRIR